MPGSAEMLPDDEPAAAASGSLLTLETGPDSGLGHNHADVMWPVGMDKHELSPPLLLAILRD